MIKTTHLLSLVALLTTPLHAKQPIALVIHGGAGTISPSTMTPEKEAAYQADLKKALDAGYQVLEQGGSSLDAVTQAVKVMEDSPLFNAGKGAVYTFDGEHELDAAIMRGDTKAAGAVAGVKIVKNPIVLARRVMEKSDHVMLAGRGAEQFAKEQGLDLVDNRYFDTPFRLEALNKAKAALKAMPHQASVRMSPSFQPSWNMGTVGAVAIDRQGNLAAATSTGGMTAKRYGRIGDAPVIGAGTYADNQSCAVSATGHGEFFIRYQVAADICARVKYAGIPADKAAETVIMQVLKPIGGTGGVIVIDAKGQVSWSFNTEGMYRAKQVEGQAPVFGIYHQNMR